MQDVAPFLRRLPVIIMLGVTAWLLAVWQLGQAALAQGVGLYLVLIVLNGLATLTALLRLFWVVATTRRWQIDNRDWVIWICLLLTYGSAFVLAGQLVLPPVESFFLGFLIINFAPLLNRWTPRLASAAFIIVAVTMAMVQHTLPFSAFVAYLLLAKFAVWYLAYCSIAEWQAHQETATAHAQLRVTQQLLADAVARNERTRIARDLHDQMGHHLVALNMQLQILERKLPSEATQELGQARELAKELFNDVRTTVQQLRHEESSFGELLDTMLANIPYLEFEVELDDGVELLGERVSSCLLRVVQEAITNSLKHSDACALSIRLKRASDGLQLQVEDNGRQRKATDFSSGHGLKGLHERIRELGGQMQAGATGQGYLISVNFSEDCLS